MGAVWQCEAASDQPKLGAFFNLFGQDVPSGAFGMEPGVGTATFATLTTVTMGVRHWRKSLKIVKCGPRSTKFGNFFGSNGTVPGVNPIAKEI